MTLEDFIDSTSARNPRIGKLVQETSFPIDPKTCETSHETFTHIKK